MTTAPQRLLSTLLLGAGLGMADNLPAAEVDYSVDDLLTPCMEGDNSARWGEVAELECEQYIVGFVDGLLATGSMPQDVCLPELSAARRTDENLTKPCRSIPRA